jgi:enoyl-CoA hydratase/carnithine racemase
MSEATLTLLRADHGAVRLLTINRPERRNAMNLAFAAELRNALEEAERDARVRVVVLTGAEGNYSAGADMQVFSDMAAGKLQGDPAVLGKLDEPLARFPKPLIAAVDGLCVGMAVTLLPFFDMVYASERATFRTPFVRLGLVLEMGSSYTLPRLIGRQRANELIYRAEPIDARTAENWGLVNRVFTNETLLAETLRVAQDVAKGGPQSVAHCKRLLIDGETAQRASATQAELATLVHCYASQEHREAVAAFFKRKG